MAVIDAQNLAWAASRAAYGGVEGGRLHFPAGVRALYGAVTALRAAGVEPIAILPEHWLRYRASPGDAVIMGALPVSSGLGLADASPAMGATELEALRALVAAGAAIVAPTGSKEHPLILAYAFERGAFVLSQDRFRDHAAAIRRAAAAGGAAGGEGMAVDGDAPLMTMSPDAAASRLAWLDSHVLGFSVRPPPAPDRPWEFIVDPQKGARLFA